MVETRPPSTPGSLEKPWACLETHQSGQTQRARSRACHRIAQGEELKLQLVLPFNERSYRTLETGRVLQQTGLVNAAEGLWQILGDDGDKWL